MSKEKPVDLTAILSARKAADIARGELIHEFIKKWELADEGKTTKRVRELRRGGISIEFGCDNLAFLTPPGEDIKPPTAS